MFFKNFKSDYKEFEPISAEILKNDKDIAYLTNIEAITYLIESKKIDITNTTIFNNSYIDLFFIVNNEEIIVKAKDKYVYMEEEE